MGIFIYDKVIIFKFSFIIIVKIESKNIVILYFEQGRRKFKYSI